MKTPDEICMQFSEEDVKLNIYKLSDSIVLEGNEQSLKFLGSLILSQADYEDDESFSIAPNGAGNKFFSKASKFGIHIHKEIE